MDTRIEMTDSKNILQSSLSVRTVSRRKWLTAAGALGTMPLPILAKKTVFEEGKDYTVISTEKFSDGPVVIHDFFSYTCPHCLYFSPRMRAYAEKIKGRTDIRFVRIPVAWDASLEVFSSVYFAFEALGRLEDLHSAFWEWVQYENHAWGTFERVKSDIAEWTKSHGIETKQWERLTKSDAVLQKVREANSVWRAYGIEATPCVGVSGKFVTAPYMAGSRQRAIEVLDFLVQQVLLDREKKVG